MTPYINLRQQEEPLDAYGGYRLTGFFWPALRLTHAAAYRVVAAGEAGDGFASQAYHPSSDAPSDPNDVKADLHRAALTDVRRRIDGGTHAAGGTYDVLPPERSDV
jgi:hypothetical protein